MPCFSNRRGAPSCPEQNASNRRRCRGRRRGNEATCRARLKGWVENVAARSPIWGDIDIAAFCRTTGYSREHATRELSQLRREGNLVFETKIRTTGENGAKQWGVMVADPAKLLFDKHSLFYGRDGKPLHTYTTLGDGGEKIPPTIVIEPRKRPRGRPRKAGSRKDMVPHVEPATPAPIAVGSPSKTPADETAEIHHVCDNPYIGEDSYGIQQPDQYGAGRDIAQWRGREGSPSGGQGPPGLRKKAFAMLERLEACHWDNCKVTFASRTAFNFALAALVDGHAAKRLVSCYADALYVCHGFAVDQAASTGKITYFNSSSTVVKAANLLARDGLTRQERVARWYRQKHAEESIPKESDLDPTELAEMRAKMLASFPR